MKKIFLFIVLLAMSSTISFGQNGNVIPSVIQSIQLHQIQKQEQYFNNSMVQNTKSFLLNEGFEDTIFPPTSWTIQNFATNTDHQWKHSSTSHSGFKAAEIDSGQIGDVRNEWLISPSIDLTGLAHPCLKFWWKMSYHRAVAPNDNYDFRVKLSTDGGINWTTAWTEDSVGQFEDWVYYQAFINLSDYSIATNFKIAFQYQGTDGDALYIDDISIENIPANNLTVDRITLHDGYTQIPSGLGMPLHYDADISNFGLYTQTHVKFHAVNLSTISDYGSYDTTLLSGKSVKKLIPVNPFFTLPTALGAYKVTSYLSSDSIPYLAQDTFTIKVVCDICKYSRDNDTYTGSRWAGTTGTCSDPYTTVNLYQVNQDRMAYGLNCVVSNDTKICSKIKAVLYKFSANGQKIIVAHSNSYYISVYDIPDVTPMQNPPSISLCFTNNGFTMQKDSIYYAGIQVFGGTDTVKIATDNTGIPQERESSKYFYPISDEWYNWGNGNVAASMIRMVFYDGIYCYDDIKEITNKDERLSCFPNPANNITKISYELNNNENVSILITDITGRKVQMIKEGKQAKGIYSVDINLSDLSNGIYFCTLQTTSAQVTEKLMVLKN